jgi:hypothetical protein
MNMRMTVEQRRAALMSARADLESTIYSMCMSLGLDVDSLDDIRHIDRLWLDPDLEIPVIAADDPEWPQFMKLQHLVTRLTLVIDKLEGPNRIV